MKKLTLTSLMILSLLGLLLFGGCSKESPSGPAKAMAPSWMKPSEALPRLMSCRPLVMHRSRPILKKTRMLTIL